MSFFWRAVCFGWLVFSGPALADGIQWRSGVWQQGNLMVGKAAPGSRIWFKGVELQLTPQGDFVFGLDRDEGAEVWLKVQVPGAKPASQRRAVARRDYEIQRIDGLPQGKVEPPASVLKRIMQEQKQIKAARAVVSEEAGFAQPFIWAARGRISGVFGSQRILNGVAKSPHNGVDVAVPTGTEIVAPADGVVTLAEPDLYYTGGTILIDHGHGLSSIMVHMSKLLAQPGQRVKQGEVVALSGMTGRATGPHLHWGMNWRGARVDPQSILPAMP